MEDHLNHFVAVTQKNGLFSSLPLLDVAQREGVFKALVKIWHWIASRCAQRSVVAIEVERKRLELLVSVKVGLEVLQKDHFFVDSRWVVEEVVVANSFLRLEVA